MGERMLIDEYLFCYTIRYMREFQEKRRLHKLLYSKPSIALLLLILCISAGATWGIYDKYSETKKNTEIANLKLQELSKQENELQAEITHLASSQGVEDEIRGKFGFSKNGEGVIVLVDEQSSTENMEPPLSAGFISRLAGKIWGLFGNK